MTYLLLAIYILAGWIFVSFAFAAIIAWAGWKLSGRQESNRFAWDKPLRYLELDASQWRRIQ
jgi:hypothetical protein